MKIIDKFYGEFSFLSNFYPSIITMNGLEYPTVEHAFQASKSMNSKERETIRNSETPGRAKKLGRSVSLRFDWDNIRVNIMLQLVRRKFEIPELREKLLKTEDAFLIEGNNWGDKFWGCVGLDGENHLGKILMQVREEIKKGL